MKKTVNMLTALLLCLTLGLCACGKDKASGGGGESEPPVAPAQFTYAATADDGVTLSATVDGVAAGTRIEEGKTLVLSATAEEGTVRVYVNDRIVSLPHTLAVSENISVRAELWFAVTVKVLNPYGLAQSAVALTENGYDAELNAQWEYTAQVRSGNSVVFAASAVGFATAQKTVTATGNARTELSVDTPVMTVWGVIRQKGDTYEIVRDETLTEADAGGISGATAFEALSDTHWIFSYKVKDIVGGAWNIVSVGAILDTTGSTSMNVYFADGAARLETLTLQPEWVHREYEVQSTLNLAAALDAARVDGGGYLSLEFVRDNDAVYMFVNGTYVLGADADALGASAAVSDRPTAFGIFTRANMGGTVYDVAYERGESAVATRLAQGKVQLTVTAANAVVQAPQTAYDGQKTEIVFTPDSDYTIDTVTVDGKDALNDVLTAENGYAFTVYAHEGLTVEIACKPIPVMYAVTGHIDVKTYDIAPSDITATANNHQAVSIDENYDYTVQAEAGELQLTFAAADFTTVTKTVTVTDHGATQDIDLDEPILTLWAPDNCEKVGKNMYDFDGNVLPNPFNPSSFMAAASRYWTVESKVHIKENNHTDWGVGFAVGSFGAAIDICYADGAYRLEAIATDNVWSLQRKSIADITEAMTAAEETNGYVTLKAVRADTLLLFYVNGTFVGSFFANDYGTANIDANDKNAGVLGLYARGGVKCTFSDVWFDLDEGRANAAVEAVQTLYGTAELKVTNATQESDGSVTTSTWLGAHYPSEAATNWIMETKLHVTVQDSSWFYAGISMNNAGWNNIDFNYAGGVTALKTYTNTEVATLTVNNGVDLSAAMLAATEENGYIALRVLRSGSRFYVFVNDTFAAETTLTDCGLAENTAYTFGLHASGGNGYECKFYDIRYTTDAVAVSRALKEIPNNA